MEVEVSTRVIDEGVEKQCEIVPVRNLLHDDFLSVQWNSRASFAAEAVESCFPFLCRYIVLLSFFAISFSVP